MTVLRSAILAAADNPRIRRFVGRYGMRLGAARFVAGETLDKAVVTLRRLNEQGLRTNTTVLGEGVKDREATGRVVEAYEEVLRRIAAEGLQTNVALKLTHLGVLIDEDLAFGNLERLVAEAAHLGNFIRIDMEDSPLVDVTLRIYRRLRELIERFPRHAALKHVLVRRGVPIREDVRAPLRALTPGERNGLDAELGPWLRAA